MSIKIYNPTTNARRNMSVIDYSKLSKTGPEKKLIEPLKKKSGRNSYGRITVRHKGGGNRQKYRVIDFKRNKFDMPATVLTIEYDPNRSAHIALIQYEDGEKTYSGEILLGRTTATDDVTGATLSTSADFPEAAQVGAACERLRGTIEQVPPSFSALKLEGRRAYDLARRGEKVDLKPRRVTVYAFDLTPLTPERYSFTLRCSPGTYVRALARDIGAALGCGACLSALRREASQPFSVSRAKTLEDLGPGDMLNWPELFPGTPQLLLDAPLAQRLAAGDQRVWGEIVALPRCREALQGRQRVLFGEKSNGAMLGIAHGAENRWSIAVTVGGEPPCRR